ncbi:thiopeptide-type bacteriocin biosynthesis protein [Streptomyces stelliscabiei]|uniref:Thiopeptide-type bacteriocin biosynthesis protein n=2 Tax=Streptomyces stelliscabiei TaxID=146820 RepID=A0A8I0TN17_9ACTN|nr:thiopeptide-type bacteriocin biosynthesis protein [Streptomyces stelliscabiei]MBE1594034.1 thiopeptide-type bacteriocin biosynthesis protein [Streptomyces stelliscabiei]MDX2521477.1 thiopeptide-type bacteriocin biosynthesis protein [Streptomyces stelliscabiei]
MHEHDISPAEDAIWSVLGGMPIADAASRAGTSPARLADAVERYRAAGRTALDASPEGWHQVNIEFADYPTAEQTFRAYLLPSLRGAPVGAWWFLRKYPCWRLRVHPSPGTPAEEVIAHVTEALDSAVSWSVVKNWCPYLYEPESVAFGGPDGMMITHRVFHTDSMGVLDYHQHAAGETDGVLDAKATSLLVTTLFLRAAGLEWGEQGDVWGQIEAKRPLPEDVPADRVSAMADTMRQLLLLDAGPAINDGPLASLQSWVTGMEHGGRALADIARDGRLGLGLRSVVSRHVLFHWNRMGFTARQQAIWSRAAREAVLGC